MSRDGRKVTERDLRMPEFRDAEPDELEFRGDGKVVRKDRWETAVQSIRRHVGISSRADFEIGEVVDRVKDLVGGDSPWLEPAVFDPNDHEPGDRFVLRLADRSILRQVEYAADPSGGFVWHGAAVTGVVLWKVDLEVQPSSTGSE
jgi:hypothetical protein